MSAGSGETPPTEDAKPDGDVEEVEAGEKDAGSRSEEVDRAQEREAESTEG